MRTFLKAVLLVSVLGTALQARAEGVMPPDPASGSQERVAVTIDGHKLRIPARMFYTAIPQSMPAMERNEATLRLDYPGLTTSRRPGKSGNQELISFEEAIDVTLSSRKTRVVLPFKDQRLVVAANDLDASVDFKSFVLPDLSPSSEIHNFYRLAEDPLLILCSDREVSFSSCRMLFDEAGLRVNVHVRRKFLTDDVRQFRQRLTELIASFKAD